MPMPKEGWPGRAWQKRGRRRRNRSGGLAWDKAKSRRKGWLPGHVATARGLKKNAYKTRAAAADQICLSISLHRLSLLLMPVSSPPPLFRFTFRQFAEPVVGLQVAPLPLLQSPPSVIAGERGLASFLNKEHGMAASGIHPGQSLAKRRFIRKRKSKNASKFLSY